MACCPFDNRIPFINSWDVRLLPSKKNRLRADCKASHRTIERCVTLVYFIESLIESSIVGGLKTYPL